jgi:hypothetical protein
LDKWGQIQTNLKAATDSKVKTLGLIETMRDMTAEDCAKIDTCVSHLDDGEPKLIMRDIGDIEDDVKAYFSFVGTTVDGLYFNRVNSAKTANNAALMTLAATWKLLVTDLKIVWGTGIALNNPEVIANGAAGAPDIVVAVSATKDDKQNWHPYAWYPGSAPTQWGALLTDVPEAKIEDMVELMFDRGYGYIGMHDKAATADGAQAYAKLSAVVTKTINAIKDGDRANYRRLQAVTDKPDEFVWSCDATLFHCRPVCMRTTGLTTMVVPDAQCEGVAKDPCGCKCLFDAAWECDGDAVVCMATDTNLERSHVGDRVCSSRGFDKPKRESFKAVMADECAPMKLTIGDYPSAQCMAKYETPYEPATAAPVINDLTEDVVFDAGEIIDSSALPAALFAFAALYA